jgi:hypothetical protein
VTERRPGSSFSEGYKPERHSGLFSWHWYNWHHASLTVFCVTFCDPEFFSKEEGTSYFPIRVSDVLILTVWFFSLKTSDMWKHSKSSYNESHLCLRMGLCHFWRKYVLERTVTQNSVGEGEALVTSMLGRKGSGTPFRLASFWERTSARCFGALRHNKYPWVLLKLTQVSCYFLKIVRRSFLALGSNGTTILGLRENKSLSTLVFRFHSLMVAWVISHTVCTKMFI